MSKDLEADILRAAEQAYDFTECKKDISKMLEQDETTIIDVFKEIAKYLGMIDNQWIPYPEQVPKEEKEYLISCKEGWVETRWYNPKEWSFFNVNAWMPLPQPYHTNTKRR